MVFNSTKSLRLVKKKRQEIFIVFLKLYLISKEISNSQRDHKAAGVSLQKEEL